MNIVNPSYEIIDNINYSYILKKIELCGRTAYKSEEKITNDSAEGFVKSIIKRGHESVIEHVSLTVKFICDRGISHEIVRHRLCAFTQESTRYCNYGTSNKGMSFIRQPFWNESNYQNDNNAINFNSWRNALEDSEYYYNNLIANGATPQEARSVIPNSLKTEIIVTANLREWRHILKLRTDKAAHPQMRQLMIPLLSELKEKLPVFFEDIKIES